MEKITCNLLRCEQSKPCADAVAYTQLKDVTNTFSRFEVSRQVRHQLLVEDRHLVACRVRNDHLGHMTQPPVVQLLHDPLGKLGILPGAHEGLAFVLAEIQDLEAVYAGGRFSNPKS